MADERVLKGQSALVTGAASGIGRAIAELFAAHGAAVAVLDKDVSGGRATEQAISADGGQAVFLEVDVTDSAACRTAIDAVRREFGGLDILVNNAGIILRATAQDTSEAQWDQVMAVNVRAAFIFSKYAVPEMVRRGGGVILNIASGWGLVGGPQAAAYCASKGALVQLTRAMAIDHGPENIRVVCLCPGDTDTPLLSAEAKQLGEDQDSFRAAAVQRPLGRLGRPEDIARAGLFMVSQEAAYVTGTTLVVDGGGLAGG